MVNESRPQEIMATSEANDVVIARPEYADEAHAGWFGPAFWGQDARPVDSGGRGSAWFVRHGEEHWVLRHYSRGGLVARISRRTYGFTGAENTRSVAEFRLLNHMFEAGLPVPRPVAAWYQLKTPVTYQAAILVCCIPEAMPFAAYLGQGCPRIWRDVGQLIRRFHEAGVDHADLNCHNILVTSSGLYLIDFDKGKLREPGVSESWAKSNLERFWRSVRKLGATPSQEARDAFDRAYYRFCL